MTADTRSCRRGALTVLAALPLALLLGAAAGVPATAGPNATTRGFVDGQAFLDLAGEEHLQVEVSIHSSLLKAVLRGLDEESRELLGGLESIHAIIVDLEGSGSGRIDQLRALIRSTRSRLEGKGWERLAVVRDEGTEVTVLVLNDETYIHGLVVMIVERDDHKLVFANVAGRLDLAAIEGLQRTFGVPGLDRIDLSDGGRDRDAGRDTKEKR